MVVRVAASWGRVQGRSLRVGGMVGARTGGVGLGMRWWL